MAQSRNRELWLWLVDGGGTRNGDSALDRVISGIASSASRQFFQILTHSDR